MLILKSDAVEVTYILLFAIAALSFAGVSNTIGATVYFLVYTMVIASPVPAAFGVMLTVPATSVAFDMEVNVDIDPVALPGDAVCLDLKCPSLTVSLAVLSSATVPIPKFPELTVVLVPSILFQKIRLPIER